MTAQPELWWRRLTLSILAAPRTQAQLHPLVDFILPVWPTANCLSPLRTDSSTAVPSAAYNAYYAQINNKIKQFSLTGLVIQLQCKASLILHGTIECYIIFDKTSYRTGLNAIKNVAPYNGITLNFCAVELDGGPIRTSTICFDNSGLDPQHPYVIVKVETAGPQYNIFQLLFGVSVHDAGALPTAQDFTISFSCQFV